MKFENEQKAPFIYLAAPFHHEDERISLNRVAAVDQYHTMLTRRGFKVFSPLTHSAHTFWDKKNRPSDPEYYINLDLEIMRAGIFTDIIILNLPGVELSNGVERELVVATELGMGIRPAEIVPEYNGMQPSLQVPCYCGWSVIEHSVKKCGMGGSVDELPCHYCWPDGTGMVYPRFDDRIKIPLILFGDYSEEEKEPDEPISYAHGGFIPDDGFIPGP